MSRLRPISAGRAGLRTAPRSRWRRLADWLLAAAVLGLLLLLAARLDRVESRLTSGSATVNDGDSITISGERIRLRGIDAPEFAQICQRDGTSYRCGVAARSALVEMIAGRPVSCTGWQRDRYGRFLGTCTAGSDDLNRSLVRSGWAIAYGDFEAEESQARDRRLGLWAGSFEPPRQWRQRHGGMVEDMHDTLGALVDWLRELFRFW